MCVCVYVRINARLDATLGAKHRSMFLSNICIFVKKNKCRDDFSIFFYKFTHSRFTSCWFSTSHRDNSTTPMFAHVPKTENRVNAPVYVYFSILAFYYISTFTRAKLAQTSSTSLYRYRARERAIFLVSFEAARSDNVKLPLCRSVRASKRPDR